MLLPRSRICSVMAFAPLILPSQLPATGMDAPSAKTSAKVPIARHTANVRFMDPPYLSFDDSAVARPGLLRLGAAERGDSETAAKTHRLNRRRRYDHHGASLLDRFVQHVHRPQVEGYRIVLVNL